MDEEKQACFMSRKRGGKEKGGKARDPLPLQGVNTTNRQWKKEGEQKIAGKSGLCHSILKKEGRGERQEKRGMSTKPPRSASVRSRGKRSAEEDNYWKKEGRARKLTLRYDHMEP